MRARREISFPRSTCFVKRQGVIHHFYHCFDHTEPLFAPSGRRQDSRQVDMIWPLWNLFDATPDGRGTDWYPRLREPNI